jgi:glycyl-tRNA synthetase alpha chain
MLDGLEISQFTYFQQCGGIDLDLVPAEMTYGLERISAFLQGVDSVYDMDWAPGVKYSEVRLGDEVQSSVYNFEMADIERLRRLFDEYEAECKRLLGFDEKSPAKAPVPGASGL